MEMTSRSELMSMISTGTCLGGSIAMEYEVALRKCALKN